MKVITHTIGTIVLALLALSMLDVIDVRLCIGAPGACPAPRAALPQTA